MVLRILINSYVVINLGSQVKFALWHWAKFEGLNVSFEDISVNLGSHMQSMAMQ
jgi:hypothetical protein